MPYLTGSNIISAIYLNEILKQGENCLPRGLHSAFFLVLSLLLFISSTYLIFVYEFYYLLQPINLFTLYIKENLTIAELRTENIFKLHLSDQSLIDDIIKPSEATYMSARAIP